MLTRPPRTIGELSHVVAIRIHDENLLSRLVGKFIERDPLSIWRPCRRAADEDWIGELYVLRPVSVRHVDRPHAPRIFDRESQFLSIRRPGWRIGSSEQEPRFTLTTRR